MTAVNLNYAVSDFQINTLTHQTIRYGVFAGLVGYMKIRTDDTLAFSYIILIRGCQKWMKCRNAFTRLKHLTAASFAILEGHVVEILIAIGSE